MEDIDRFVELLLRDREAEEFQGKILLNVESELKVESRSLRVCKHVIDELSIASENQEWNDFLEAMSWWESFHEGSDLLLETLMVICGDAKIHGCSIFVKLLDQMCGI